MRRKVDRTAEQTNKDDKSFVFFLSHNRETVWRRNKGKRKPVQDAAVRCLLATHICLYHRAWTYILLRIRFNWLKQLFYLCRYPECPVPHVKDTQERKVNKGEEWMRRWQTLFYGNTQTLRSNLFLKFAKKCF